MEFSVAERLLLLKALGAVEGNLATLRLVRDLQQELGFSEKEHKDLGFREEGGMTLWNESNTPPKEVPIGPAALDAALVMFEKLDGLQKLTFENLPLYERLLTERDSSQKGPVAI